MSSPPLEWEWISLDGTLQFIPRDVVCLVHFFILFDVPFIATIDLSYLRITIDNRLSHRTLIRPEAEDERRSEEPDAIRTIPLVRISIVITEHTLEHVLAVTAFKETLRWSF
jgi:hypothetical protein